MEFISRDLFHIYLHYNYITFCYYFCQSYLSNEVFVVVYIEGLSLKDKRGGEGEDVVDVEVSVPSNNFSSWRMEMIKDDTVITNVETRMMILIRRFVFAGVIMFWRMFVSSSTETAPVDTLELS